MEINREKLTDELNEIIRSQDNKSIDECAEEVLEVILHHYKREFVFKEQYASIRRFGYNVFISELADKIKSLDIKCGSMYVLALVNTAIEDTELYMDSIQKAADMKIESASEKAAYYDMVNENHIITALAYSYRPNFLYNIVRTIDSKRIDANLINADYSAILDSLFEIVPKFGCSRLQRALDILLQHGDDLSMLKQNTEENMKKLGLSHDDIYSLQLYAKEQQFSRFNFIKEIYNLMAIQDINGHQYNFIDILPSLWHLHSQTGENFLSNSNERINQLISELNILLTTEKLFINDYALNDIINTLESGNFDINKFKSNIVKTYLESIKGQLSRIRSLPIVLDTSNIESSEPADPQPASVFWDRIIKISFFAIIGILFLEFLGCDVLSSTQDLLASIISGWI
ncbi:hypothetical protein NEPAR06_0653 [Nematocida parisii]|nr:hypothetical protein NEPAR08_0835 [Nematocida parisii]KAI5127265.1 hypothetical protein NEPAR03_0869 [Nematocida parisii]KAI5143554.1 hypothetical protein NEPAR07_0683 [Nematocida parisii]KAI5153674.1 hypothetical protein NEPAR06_0653 [Nematocida parisii]KAI5156576.1 hypothetical protein NEPAR05_0691 [Nematocida parisii]